MTNATRPPPYPPDTRARGWRFELDMEKVKASDTWLRAKTGEVRGALMLLWGEAWQQTPCGSLPSDDELVALIIDMPGAKFAKHKAVLMRGWWAAEDGRLYHDTIVDRVLHMLEARASDAQRSANRRARLAATNSSAPGVTGASRVTPPGDHGESATRTRTRNTSAKADVDAASGSKTTTRGTRLPNTWAMSPEDKAFCEQHRPDLVPVDVEAQFRDFWTSKAGKDGVKLDWAATFRNWVRSQRQLPGSAPGERASWWSSKTGITAKGLELVIPGPADSSDAAWFEFMAAVWLAAGDGPWLDEKSRAYPIYKRLRDGTPALSVVASTANRETAHAG